MAWCLRGRSPGRAELAATTHAEDLALAFMATSISKLTRDKDRLPTVASVLAACADALRDACLGQFITHVQGASAMQAVRERNPQLWQQKKALNRICAQMHAQVKPQLLEEERGERVLKTRGHRKVLQVMQGEKLRRIELRPPDPIDWEVMSLCWAEGDMGADTSTSRSLWLAFAGVFLAAAQKVGGWFEVGERRVRHGRHVRSMKVLALSERAHGAIKADADRWVGAGFDLEPMLVPPADGDYLTVKHRKVTGQKAPLGLGTKPEETTPWITGACSLADTPWTINHHALPSDVPEQWPAWEVLKVAAHRRLAQDTFHLPVTMDFRGRVYYLPTRVTPQSGDLGKSLLCFPPKADIQYGPEEYSDYLGVLAMHLAGLYGGPQKLDKAPMGPRVAWLGHLSDEALEEVLARADKPLTLSAHLELMKHGETDRIPIQLDGTCNGLQHLSAMFRDEEGARHVNLTRSTVHEAPADIYGHVAGIAAHRVWLEAEGEDWALRLVGAGVQIDRSLCKSPVMVLPYGGTREAVRKSVKASLLERLNSLGTNTPWHAYEKDGYGAFKERALADHPLFNADAGELASLIWGSIAPAIPKAMGAMATLQSIGAWVGERALSWRVGVGPVEQRLWVTQAKSKAVRKQVTMRGFHLPAMVRRLTLNVGLNEIDPKAHRTGIVANFIHSQDAAHLAASVALFRERGGGCVGSVHDCVMVRPSEAALMGRCLREAFVALYEEDPLSQPVRLISPWGKQHPEEAPGEFVEEFPSWYALAGQAGVAFPERGSYDIREVLESAWFFS